MTALAELKRMPSTKKEIASFVASAKNEILSGCENPLVFEVQLKALEETIKAIRGDEDVKEVILKELNTYPEKAVIFNGVTFTKKATSTYDYTEDTRWNELNAKLSAIKAEIKSHEEMLKTIKEPLYNAETGEEIKPAFRFSKDTYSVTFK
jgi:hypothetical protein